MGLKSLVPRFLLDIWHQCVLGHTFFNHAKALGRKCTQWHWQHLSTILKALNQRIEYWSIGWSSKRQPPEKSALTWLPFAYCFYASSCSPLHLPMHELTYFSLLFFRFECGTTTVFPRSTPWCVCGWRWHRGHPLFCRKPCRTSSMDQRWPDTW